MKILFLCDYFPPFSKGGAEISSFLQAKELSKKDVKVVVLSPRYREKKTAFKENFKRYWYFFPFPSSRISPLMFLNPFFIFYLFLNILKVYKKEKFDLIHCQGKYSVPSAIFIKWILKIPVVVSLRDYKGICSHGFCLYSSTKGCNLFSFFKKDFKIYYKNYILKKNFLNFILQSLIAFSGRLRIEFLSFFMKKADFFISVSDFVRKVYGDNGYPVNKIRTVYNLPPDYKTGVLKSIDKYSQDKIDKAGCVVLYAGKLSLGKGAQLLIKCASQLKKENFLFIFAGGIHLQNPNPNNNKNIVFLGKIEHNQVIKLMEEVDIVCIPSIWPEPLSRVVFEAFFLKKPVLSSNVGGQSELVDQKCGWLFKPAQKELIQKLKQVLKEKEQWITKGKIGYLKALKIKETSINKLITIYKRLCN